MHCELPERVSVEILLWIFLGLRAYLKVAANDEEVDSIPASNLTGFGDGSIYSI